MQSWKRAVRSFLIMLGVASLVGGVSGRIQADHHEPQEPAATPETWDRTRVTALVRELAGFLEYGREVAAKEPDQDTVLQQRRVEASKSAFERARRAAKVYLDRMQEGASRDESDRYFRTVREHLRSAVQTAGNADPSPEVDRLLSRLREIGRELERQHALP
ncbi:MAG: hypothetical protein AAGC67_02290 [Myxococcota bacterium]